MRKICIVGGVAAGASCAARLRRLDEFTEIIVFEKSGFISYANCGLPYYVGKEIADFGNLILHTPESLYKRFRIDVRTNSEVLSVDTGQKKIRVKGPEGTYEETYDVLVLAPGCFARKMYGDFPVLRNVEDVQRIDMLAEDVDSAVVIGGGFVGIELAENLAERGKKVTVLEYADHILTNLDEDLVAYLEEELRRNGIDLRTSVRIRDAKQEEKVTITFEDGSSMETDLLVSSAGVLPATAFLEGSGVTLDQRGYILVDGHMRTNVPDVYAAGDAVLVNHLVTGKKTAVPLAGPANKEGRIAADNIAGLNSTFKGALGTSIIKVFDLAGGSTGLNSAQLKREGIEFGVICIHPSSHAGYYPGSSPLHIKLFYETASGEILGAQAVGKEGVDKFIDVIATAMNYGAKADELADLDLAYAPPFGSAKSPANYLGFIAGNVRNGLEELVTVEEALNSDEKHVLLDVRTNGEYSRGSFPNSVHIPVDELRDRLAELQPYKNKILDVYCAVGIRGHIASRILRAYGYQTRNVTGAYTTYQAYRK